MKVPLQSGLFFDTVHKSTNVLKFGPSHIHFTQKLKKTDKENLL